MEVTDDGVHNIHNGLRQALTTSRYFLYTSTVGSKLTGSHPSCSLVNSLLGSSLLSHYERLLCRSLSVIVEKDTTYMSP